MTVCREGEGEVLTGKSEPERVERESIIEDADWQHGV
jgi:hypothetical protein